MVSPQHNTVPADVELDARGMVCPLPLLKAKQALQRLPPGGVLRVMATDPASMRDFRAWSRLGGHALLVCREVFPGEVASGEVSSAYEYVLRKSDNGEHDLVREHSTGKHEQ